MEEDAVVLEGERALGPRCAERGETPGERDYRRVLGGLLVQERDVDVDDRQPMTVVAGTVTEEQWGDILFDWSVCKNVS